MSRVLLQAWQATLRRHGARRAVVEAATGRSATFDELDAAAEAWVATHAGSRAALAGRAVVFARPNGVAWLELFLGLLKAGAVVVPLDPGEPAAAQQRLAEQLRAGAWWDGERLQPRARSRRYRDPATGLIKLTSGSTGQPRALVFTDAQMLADGRQVAATMGITPRDLNYALIPFGHSYGLGNLTIPLLAGGVSVVCGTAPLPEAIATDFVRYQPTVFPGVPAMWRALAGSAVALRGLRLAISAGGLLAAEVAKEFTVRHGLDLHNFYGSSETGGIAYDRTGKAAFTGGVGRALRGVRLRARAGQRLEVSSAAVVTHGNRRRVGAQGAWLMSDRVTLDARGNVALLGRRDKTVKIAGRRVSLTEVEARLRRLAGVRDAWVAAVGGAEPTLVAVVASDRNVMDLRAELLADTATWRVPKKIRTLAALPMTGRGKLDTRALRALVE
jgi:acyl-CoA synthetase (AMP-forming)/AMP-acid ligase II